MAENYRERNRRHHERNAFRNLRDYARGAGISDPEKAAEQRARAIHGGAGVGAAVPAPAKRKKSGEPAQGAAPKSTAPAEKAPRKASAAAGKAAPKATGAAAGKAASKATGAEGKAARKGSAPEEKVPHRLEDRTREQLYARAQELEIEGRSQMTKAQLIESIRNHP